MSFYLWATVASHTRAWRKRRMEKSLCLFVCININDGPEEKHKITMAIIEIEKMETGSDLRQHELSFIFSSLRECVSISDEKYLLPFFPALWYHKSKLEINTERGKICVCVCLRVHLFYCCRCRDECKRLLIFLLLWALSTIVNFPIWKCSLFAAMSEILISVMKILFPRLVFLVDWKQILIKLNGLLYWRGFDLSSSVIQAFQSFN